ncbi:somatostatin receptor type 5-like [Gadus macrocephalus]|uniref:somatostatin receptor type 5-like n=1 Tax=Gadus macrocephalus TaxID=80720 RepID=UPI0028CB6B89|nr:somatostatin receptor type 5-like [Gadus macrocephalus]
METFTMNEYSWMSEAEDMTHRSPSSTPQLDYFSNSNAMNTSYLPTNDTNDKASPFFGSWSVATAIIYITVFIVGLLGNTLVIYVVVRYAKMKTVTNMYILNLAVADELYILGIPILGTQSVLSYWLYGEFLCKVYMTADAMSQFTSIFCLTAMSIDRYLAVVHPIRSAKWRRPQVAKVFMCLVWVMSFLVVLPVTIYSDVQDRFNSCNMSWPEPQDLWSTVFILYTAILGFFAPLLVICLCYLLIVIKVRSSSMRAGLTTRRQSERKVTRMVVIIVVVFVMCWLPFFITNIVNLVHIIPENSVSAVFYFFSVILTYVNSCANPFLYGFLSDNFKQSFRKVLCLQKGNGLDTTIQSGGTQAAIKKNPSGKPGGRHSTNGNNTLNTEADVSATVKDELLPQHEAVVDQTTL